MSKRVSRLHWTTLLLASLAVALFASMISCGGGTPELSRLTVLYSGDIEGFLKQPLGQEGLLQLRDAIAMGLSTVPLVVLFVVSSAMQNWRKKLRGGAGEGRPGGGYR